MTKIVPAMEKIDRIFKYIYIKEKATQTCISKDLEIPKATTNRILHSLVELGYLNLHEKDYSLGSMFTYFSNEKEKYNIIRNISQPYLEELSLKFRETFKLSVLEKNKIRVISKIESNDFHKITVAEKAIFPLHAGAASKLLICQLSEKKLNSLLPETLSKYTNNTITSKDELKKELFKINIKKIAFDNMEHSDSICAVATPIYDDRNVIIAALSCPYFSNNQNHEKINEIIESMKIVCNDISNNLKNIR